MDRTKFPPHWETVQLTDERLFSFENGIWTGKKPPFQDCPVIRNTNFRNDGSLDFSDVALISIEARQLTKKRLQKNDIIIERSGGGPEQPVGRVVLFPFANTDYCFSNFTTRLRVQNSSVVDPVFLHKYLLYFHLSGGTGGLQRRTTGIRNLDFAEYKKAVIPLPPIIEQHAIARALRTIQDAQTARQRELALERERKAALMEYLFTHGTRGETRKQTDIGEIPESWKVAELDTIADIVYGAQAAVANSLDSSIGVPIFTNINITNEGILDLATLRYYSIPESNKERLILKKGDLLFNWRSGSQYHVGKTALFELDGAFTFSSFILRFRPKEGMDNVFLLYYLHRMRSRGYFRQNRQQSSVNSVFNASVAATIPIAIPLFQEQNEVANVLSKCDVKIAAFEREAALLDELFRALLEELMTGRVSSVSLIGE